MKKVEYSCNLCLETKTTNELTCLKWGFPEITNKPETQRFHLTHNINDSEKHICDNCVNEVKAFNNIEFKAP